MKPTVSRTRVIIGIALAALTIAAGCTPEDAEKVAAHYRQQEAALASAPGAYSLSDAQLLRLRQCESSNNYRASNPSGKYTGAYQFDQRTWNSVASSVMPSYIGVRPLNAPASIQDAMARGLYSQRGRSPWPLCGKRL